MITLTIEEAQQVLFWLKFIDLPTTDNLSKMISAKLAQPNHIADERKKVCPRCGKVNPAEIHTCSPQQRKWQWLTDEEVDEAAKERWVAKQSFEAGAWWANEKLQEKNV